MVSVAQQHEWLIPDLARYLSMPVTTLDHWVRKGWVKARQLNGPQGRWIVWADAKEVQRLQHLHSLPRGYGSRKHFFEGKEPKV